MDSFVYVPDHAWWALLIFVMGFLLGRNVFPDSDWEVPRWFKFAYASILLTVTLFGLMSLGAGQEGR